MTTSFIEALLNPAVYKHHVDYLKLLETHISWVILTGQYAYKIKKPVDFGFINYSTLEKRHYYCDQELLLNAPLAAEIYQKVVPIVKTADGYLIEGDGEPVEYAVQMKEFSQQQLLNYILPRHGLTAAIIESIAIQLAYFHLKSPSSVETPFGTPEIIEQFTQQNFDQAHELLKKFGMDQENYLIPLNTLKNTQPKIDDVFAKRKSFGFIRSCHGDLHLGNITLINGKPIIFDCVEFNDDLRWTDVMGDVGFLMMDLYDHQRKDYALQFLNTYLTYTGDYSGLAVLPYYFAYRCMVRAKIQLFNVKESDTEEIRKAYYDKYASYVALALDYLKDRPSYMLMMHGFSGSGKSTLANRLSQALSALVIRSDVERKRLFDLQPEEDSQPIINGKLYQPEVTQRTYAQLKLLATIIIKAGYPVIVDATCLEHWQRQLFIDLAQEINVPYAILDCQATEEELTARLANADHNTRFFSEATVKVLASQQKIHEPLTEEERAHAIVVTTDPHVSIDVICEKVRGLHV